MLEKWTPQLLSLARIVWALIFLQHGTQKLFQFPPSPMGHAVPLFSLLGLAAVLELVGGSLLLLGLFTRPVSFVVSGEMAFAYFIGHAPRGFFPATTNGDLPVVLCFAFLYLAAAGAGPWSMDAWRQTRT